MDTITAQLIGGIALLLITLSFQRQTRVGILLCLATGQLFFVVHYALLGAWTASALNIVAALRGWIFSRGEKEQSLRQPAVLWAFVLAFWAAGAVTWAGPISLLPVIGQTIETFGFWLKTPKYIRLVNLFPRPLWFLYSYFVFSIPGMALEGFVTASLLLGLYRFDVQKVPVR